jgi:RimJ/RimL family protein N-acetyltransferase
MSWFEPVVLEGVHARLEPLSPAHCTSLIEAVADGELWQLWYTSIPSPNDMLKEIERRLALQSKGSMIPFAVMDATGTVVGMTTYMNIDALNRRLEIGSTWYARRAQRTAVNTQCKLLLLTHAFEQLACIAVEFRTHYFNRQSRQGIERLGAKLDGILRSHQIGQDGTLRDTVVYSIIASEWPTVKKHLSACLNRHIDAIDVRSEG